LLIGNSMIPWNQSGRTAFAKWAAFCRQAVHGGIERSIATWTDKNGTVKEIDISELGMSDPSGELHGRKIDLDDATVEKMLQEQREWRVKLEAELRMKWRDGT